MFVHTGLWTSMFLTCYVRLYRNLSHRELHSQIYPEPVTVMWLDPYPLRFMNDFRLERQMFLQFHVSAVVEQDHVKLLIFVLSYASAVVEQDHIPC